MDYIHFNPVKHGHVKRVIDWPYSSFHRYVKEGVYEPDWGVGYDENRNVGEPVSCPLLGKRVGTKSVTVKMSSGLLTTMCPTYDAKLPRAQ